MLFDPNWNKPKTKPNTFASVVEWLEKQDPNQTYEYTDPHYCLAAQYHDAVGTPYRLIRTYFKMLFGNWSFDAKLERVAHEHPRTFGAALERARKHLP